jgi:hypothetical protein
MKFDDVFNSVEHLKGKMSILGLGLDFSVGALAEIIVRF